MFRTCLVLALMTANAAAQEIVDQSGGTAEATEFVGRITKGLLDPGSAQIRGISRSPQNQDIICSLMNAKNAMGGYTGFHIAAVDMKTNQRFVYAALVGKYGPEWTDTVIVSKTGCPRD
jgi:hypothetical protein